MRKKPFALGTTTDPFLASLLPRLEPVPALEKTRVARCGNFDEAAIYTIHGFCQRMLQDRAFESGVPFSAELITDQSPIVREVVEDFWRQQLLPSATRVLTAFALHSGLDAGALDEKAVGIVSKPFITISPAAGRLAALQADLTTLFADLRRCWAADARPDQASFHAREIAGPMARSQQGTSAKMEVALDGAARLPFGERRTARRVLRSLENSRSRRSRSRRERARSRRGIASSTCASGSSRCAREYALALEAEFLEWARAELPQTQAAAQRAVLR